ncbi:MAG: rRNA maturation RNAse YbeY [Candidatus Zambryskibacteria bacterium]|nr:rRNA maturation RNAse YbeY [Candidatus Zambryskibacteria bacterium]
MKLKNPLDAGRTRIKNKILGKKYELSLVLAKDALMRRLNRTYRGKDKSVNVLAFPLSKTSGEIFINPARVEPFGTKHLFVHALLHLKGMRHGAKMNKVEQQLLNGASNRSRR